MSHAALAALGITLEIADGGFAVRCGERDWLRAVLVCFGFGVRVHGEALAVATVDRQRLEHTLLATFAPSAALFDLDGVLMDLGRGRRLVDPAALSQLAATRPIGVVTTCPREMAESALEHCGLRELCGAVVSSDDGPSKPDPFPVRLALERLGSATGWMLGDNPSDVRAARAAGVLPFAIAPRGIGSQSHADRLRAAGALQLLPDAATFAALCARRPVG
ncbi:MAG: HAD-IA family hydrolase [Planctomycetes bacterium]|nr:HAD-IA family hydrolase [Planctomycetota bacterium]